MISGRKPQGGGKVGHWMTAKVKKGSQFNGHVAGPCIGVEVHCGSQSKPCLKFYLGSSVECPGCKNNQRRGWLGYQPLYRWLDGKPVVAWFHEDQQDRLDVLKHGDHVLVGREDADNAGNWIRKEKGPAFTTRLPVREVDADISDWLPTIFRLKGVLTGEHLRGGPATTPVTPDCHSQPKKHVVEFKVTDQSRDALPDDLRKQAEEQRRYWAEQKKLRGNGAFTLNGDGEHSE